MKQFISGKSAQIGKLALLAVMISAHTLFATTLHVGTCKSGSYSTIQAAINAAPVGAIVQVCPGNYPEQVTIIHSVTLQGITANNGDQAIISAPSGGLVVTATDLFGDPVAAQITVVLSGGPVNISNLELDGTGNKVTSGILNAGIYYRESPGIINGVTTMNQLGNNLGIGIFLEGGASNPSVTVQNSFVEVFDYAGVDFETVGHPNTALTAKITNNYVSPLFLTSGIQFGSGTTATVSGNWVVGPGGSSPSTGLLIGAGAAGSVSSNTVMTVRSGIETHADGVSVTSNKLSQIYYFGIDLQTSNGAVSNNLIMNSGIGIVFECNSNPNVRSNTMNFNLTGLAAVPAALSTSTNKVFNTPQVRVGGCN